MKGRVGELGVKAKSLVNEALAPGAAAAGSRMSSCLIS
jgi:hypothetical protein